LLLGGVDNLSLWRESELFSSEFWLILNFVQREVRLSAIALLSLSLSLSEFCSSMLSLSLSLLLFFVEELSKGWEEFRAFVTRAVVAKKLNSRDIYFCIPLQFSVDL
jgi:hypothetical protein